MDTNISNKYSKLVSNEAIADCGGLSVATELAHGDQGMLRDLYRTSFGVTLGLFDYLADLFKIDNSHGGRFKTVLLTFLPPALLYLIFPNGFIYGIGGAGLCATIWAVIIPAVLAIKARKKFPNQMFTVWGGNLIPAIVILFGITVILCWFGNVFNVLPKFG